MFFIICKNNAFLNGFYFFERFLFSSGEFCILLDLLKFNQTC